MDSDSLVGGVSWTLAAWLVGYHGLWQLGWWISWTLDSLVGGVSWTLTAWLVRYHGLWQLGWGCHSLWQLGWWISWTLTAWLGVSSLVGGYHGL